MGFAERRLSLLAARLHLKDLSELDTSAQGRVADIDGIRGWAALSVVVFHFGYETFGTLFPIFRHPVFAAFNGRLAVCVFFVLSGEALSSAFFAGGGGRAVASLAIKRHSRLSLPVLASTFAVVVLQRLGWVRNGEAAAIVARQDWLGTFLPQQVGWGEALTYAVTGVYQSLNPSVGHVIPFGWTIGVEMIGSLLVFLLLFLWPHLRFRSAVLAALLVILLSSFTICYLAGFVAGVWIAYVRRCGLLDAWRERLWMSVASGSAIMACMVLSATIYAGNHYRQFVVIGVVLVIALHLNRPARAFFSSTLSQLLGRISFALYLVQFPVIVSFTSWMIVRAQGPMTLNTALQIAALSLLVVVAAAAAFQPVEWLTTKVGRWISRHGLSERGRGVV